MTIRLTAPFLVKTIALCLVVIGLAWYGIYQARNMLNGPVIIITAPSNGADFTDPLITIEGFAHNISYISLNDRPIFVDQKGAFSEKLLLPAGYTIMKMHAQDKFGRQTQQLLELTYTPAISPSTNINIATTSATSNGSSSVMLLKNQN